MSRWQSGSLIKHVTPQTPAGCVANYQYILRLSGIDSAIHHMLVGANTEVFGDNLLVFRALQSDDIAPMGEVVRLLDLYVVVVYEECCFPAQINCNVPPIVPFTATIVPFTAALSIPILEGLPEP